MNPLKTMEERLKAWTPRRPSPGLKRRLFGVGGSRLSTAFSAQVSDAASSEAAEVAFRAGWLAPTFAAFVIGFFMVVEPGSRRSWVSSADLGTMMAFSQPELSSYYGAGDHAPHNTWGTATLESTKPGTSLSTQLRFFATNSVKH